MAAARNYGRDSRQELKRRSYATKGVGTFRMLFMGGLLMAGGTYAGRQLQDQMMGGLQEWSGLYPQNLPVSAPPVLASASSIDF